MAACDRCGCRFTEPEDEIGDHPCPRCGAAPWDDEKEDDAMITADEVAAINEVRTALKLMAQRLFDEGHSVKRGAGHCYRCGMTYEAVTTAADALFGVLNAASSFGLVEISQDQLHNRTVEQQKAAA